ncbi:MAG: GerMN domain-containing protein [Acidobacteriaceae bacterium]
MIPRYQRIFFWVLLVSSAAMAIYLVRLRERAQDRIMAVNDPTPIAAPSDMPAEMVTLDIANDTNGALTPVQQQITLPQEPNFRIRALLEHLLAEYALPQSTHPLSGGPAVDDVFLLPIPGPNGTKSTEQMAVVNLRSSFVDNHPSGIEVETLTLLSIAGTIHANMPNVQQVRFLVDGQPRETLAGHADLTRTYLTTNISTPVPSGTTP